ncbi:eCIS core domain-containing protein [Pontibacter pamirensis]|uniref:eCIS core domain-containing protein n=1 Tax=Pontibacter pamirensis TaxID=2562824 RepID=UPI00138A3774|nr:DUF4157 domain-containing protein [Pontibacter pamirensis]
MKTAEAKTTATTSKQNKPFFQRKGEQSFFGKNAAYDSFFTTPSPIVQTKLTIGQPGDIYEQEADAMADQVVQRLNNPETIQTKPNHLTHAVSPLLQPKCSACEEEERVQKKEEEEKEPQMMAKPASDKPAQTNSLQSQLNASKEGGFALSEDTKASMGNAFDADFSEVKVHTDNQAVQMNKNLNAQAFTHGSDIYFNKGKYEVSSSEGQHLLAHELTHVVQQRGEGVNQKGLSKLSGNFIHKQEVCEAPDYNLNETPIYDESQGVCESQEAHTINVDEVNNFRSIPFYTIAKVLPASGIRLHTTPSVQDPDYQNKTGRASDFNVQPKGSFVTILGVGTHPHVGWVKIKTQTGFTGWIEQRFLQSLIPLPVTDDTRKGSTRPPIDQLTRELHYIEPGDKLETLIDKYYKDYPYETGNDRRTIAYAFFILNEENPGVSLTGSYDDSFWKDTILDRDFSETRKIYQTIQLYHGYWIRFPSIYYINLQRDLGAVGVRLEWKNTTIAIGRGVQGFFEGVVAGFAQAAVDMVVDLWDLVKGIFTGELFKKGYQLVKQFIELYQKEGIGGIWRVISGFFKGIYKSFIDKWNTPNPRQRWKFIGEIVGMIIFEVVLAILTAGVVTALKWSGRLAKVLKKFPSLDNIVRSGAKTVERLKASKGKAVETAKDLRDKKRLGFSNKEWDNFIANKDKNWTEVKGSPDLLRLEIDGLKKSRPRRSLEPGYDVEIELPNGHVYRRKKDGSGWCRFSDYPEGCGDIPVDDYIGWDPELEEKWNRELLGETEGKKAARDVKAQTPKEERMMHLFRQLQRARDQYMGKNPSWKPRRDGTVEAVIRRMRKQGKVNGVEPNESVKVIGPDGKEGWYHIDEVDMGHVPVDAVEYWNKEGYKYGAQSKKVRDWMKDPNNYELEHSIVNQRKGAAIASTMQYRRPLR